jgi:hypothetical protein
MSTEFNMDAERAAFEVWARGKHIQLTMDVNGEGYHYPLAKAAWGAWQAARRTVDTSVAPVSAPIVEELPTVESVAKAMAIHSGWDNWDTAQDCRHTPSGNEPDEEREYWRELANLAIAPYAERIRQLERELKHAKLQELVDIAQECDMGYGKPAERKTASIGDDPKFQELLEEYDDAASHTAILHSLNALITYIDNFKNS